MAIPQHPSTLQTIRLGEVELAYTEEGNGPTVLCIHGSWDDHHSWSGVAKLLNTDFRVISYDRRGHSQSTAPDRQGCISEDVEDAAALLEQLSAAPAHILGHSYGANIAISLAKTHPGVTKSLFLHEPPVFSVLSDGSALASLGKASKQIMDEAATLLEQGEIERGARLFIEDVAFGPGSWSALFDRQARETILRNAYTWLDQYRDPERLAINVSPLQTFPGRITLSTGTKTLAPYGEITDCIAKQVPAARVARVEGAGHGAHISHPEETAKNIRSHIAN